MDWISQLSGPVFRPLGLIVMTSRRRRLGGAVVLAFGCSFANAAANAGCGVDVPGRPDWVWRPASDIAIKLPADSSPAYGEGPGHSSVLWKLPAGTVVARYGMAPIDWWADEVKKICSSAIDGHRAEIYRIVHSGRDELAAVFRQGALGPDLTITLPLASRRNVATELAELLSVVFKIGRAHV